MKIKVLYNIGQKIIMYFFFSIILVGDFYGSWFPI